MTNAGFLPDVHRRQFLQLLGGSAALIALNGCTIPSGVKLATPAAGAVEASSPQRGGVLRLVFTDDLLTLNPGTSSTFADVDVAKMLYDALFWVSEGEEGAPIYPMLAESWELNEDATVYTLHLRPNVVFQHGTPFTAKDVEYSINRMLDPASGTIAASLSMVERVEVLDELTVTIHLREPNVALPTVLGGPFAQIVPHDRTTEQLSETPAGTGPFVLAEYVPGERIVFKRNENYWDPERPYLDEVQVIVIPEVASQLAALTSGLVDFLQSVSLENLAILQESPDVTLLEGVQGYYPVFAMRVDQKPFDDVRVRQAIKHAVDRNALHSALMLGRGSVGNDQPMAPGTPFWAEIPPLDYDVEKAKALLAEAGYSDGLEVTLTIAEIGGPRINEAAVAIQEMVKAAGITVLLEKVPASSYYVEKYMQVPFYISWWPTLSDPETVMPVAFTASGIYNESGWSDPRAEELIAVARGEQDVEKRKALYAELQQLISEEGGVLIPYVAPLLQAVRKNVHGHIPALPTAAQKIWVG